MAAKGKRKAPGKTAAMPKGKRGRPQLSLPEISDIIQQNITDPEGLQRLLDYSTSLAEAAKKAMSSSTVCTVCKKGGGGSKKPLRKCICRNFTVCWDCEVDDKLEDTDVIECPICDDLVCEANKGKCRRQKCEVCNKECCNGCMTKTECEVTTLCDNCKEDYECPDCDFCEGY